MLDKLRSRFRKKLDLQALLSSDARIVEVGAKDLELARFLFSKGSNYLSLVDRQTVDRQTVEASTASAGALSRHVYPYEGPGQLGSNSTDVLIFGAGLERRVWSFHVYYHAKYLLWSPSFSFSTLLALIGVVKNLALKRVEFTGLQTLELERGPRTFCTLRVLKRAGPAARRYLSPLIGIEGFFKRLQEHQINYAILRWFESMPAIEAGEDIDLLVADEDLERLEGLMNEKPGTLPCDLYSVSGLPGTSYRNIAYYPPPLAKKLLERAVVWRDHYRVPSAEDHFLSLAYHALYHKGERSGLPTTAKLEVASEPEHDYRQVLKYLAVKLKIDVEVSLEGLDAYLHSRGWRPPLDTITKLAKAGNAWLSYRLATDLKAHNELEPGLAVFFIRRKALEAGFQDDIVSLLVAEGFSIVLEKALDEDQRKRVQEMVRGGNWNKGPWPQSGGEPVVAVVAYDLIPIPPGGKVRAQYPILDNERVLVKEKIRQYLNERLAPGERCHMLHASDNAAEALSYLQIALPEEVESVLARVEGFKRPFLTSKPVLKRLINDGARAKLELIEYEGGLAVKKTFRPGCERFAARERLVMEHLSPLRPELPPLLEAGDNFVIYPYYEDTLRFDQTSAGLLPLGIVKQSMEVLRFFYERGYALIDFAPENLLVDRKTGLKVIDFEFLYQYEEKTVSLAASYDLAGLPADFTGDAPHSASSGYSTRWKPFVGLELDALLHKPVWLQHALRFRYALLHLLPRRAKAGVTSAFKALNIRRAVTPLKSVARRLLS